MKHIIALLMAAAIAFTASAADNTKPELFKAGEFNLELGGTATIDNEQRSADAVNLGVGIGANYWITRGFGFGLRGEANDTAHSIFDRAIGRLQTRAPLWDKVAPYGFLDGGYDFERNRAFAGAGGGLEWRPVAQLGFFAEAGLSVDVDGKGWMRGAAGIRFPF